MRDRLHALRVERRRALVREVARGLVFDDRGRLLLIRWRDPVAGHEFVEPPGGLVEDGESDRDALAREIAEETGLVDVEVVRFVREVDHVFVFGGRRYACLERYYLCRLTGKQHADRQLEAVEQEGIVGVEWWPIDELRTRPPGSVEPAELFEMLADVGRLDAP